MRGIMGRVFEIFANNRAKGLSSSLVGVAKINPNAVIVVGSYRMKETLMGDHDIPKHQVFTVDDFLNRSRGMNLGPLLFDACAIGELLRLMNDEHGDIVDTQAKMINTQQEIINKQRTKLNNIHKIINESTHG